jgi:SNF2 family DNA or RNA helicase
VLPFILRRTKAQVASDLPSKTVVDVLCPLSAVQQQMYREYLSEQRTSDDILEQEVVRLQTDIPPGFTLDADAVVKAEPHTAGTVPSSAGLGLGMPPLEDDEFPMIPVGIPTATTKAQPRTNSLQAVNYLKQLCVHPALVVGTQHHRYRERLLRATDSSGKLSRLAVLLLDGGVVTKDECNGAAALEALRSLEDGNNGTGTVSVASGGNSDSSDAEVDEVSGDEGEKDTSQQEAPSKHERKRQRLSSPATTTAGKRGKAANETNNADAATATLLRDSLAAVTDTFAAPGGSATAAQHRCLIFAQHKATLDLVEETVMRRFFPSVGYARLDGDVDPARRAAIAKDFNSQPTLDGSAPGGSSSIAGLDPNSMDKQALVEAQLKVLKHALPSAAYDNSAAQSAAAPHKDTRILLMTTRSCGLGLTLTAADTVIFVEHDWNPFADLQAMDRVHRLGQTRPVTVYRLLGTAAPVYCIPIALCVLRS